MTSNRIDQMICSCDLEQFLKSVAHESDDIRSLNCYIAGQNEIENEMDHKLKHVCIRHNDKNDHHI